MDMSGAIRAVIEQRDLTEQQMLGVMRCIMTGQATAAQIGGFLVGLRMKGETVDEIAAGAKVMRELVTPVVAQDDHLVDTCGTGGDGASSFNVSTASAFVVAAAGGKVAKHGNRSVSSKSGSADLLECAGVNLDLTPQQVAQCIEQVGLGFLFAPKHHSAMKHAIGPRKELGVRTIFNLLGPLTNPASAPNQVVGVFSAQWLVPMAEVLKKLGSHRVMVVHGRDGLDEISIGAATQVAELKAGRVECYEIAPQEFGMSTRDIGALKVDDASQSLAMIRQVFEGKMGAALDIVLLNAGAAIYVAGLAPSHAQGVERAREVILSGKVRDKLEQLITLTNQFA